MKRTLRSKVALAVVMLAPVGAALVAQPAAAQVYQYRVAPAEPGYQYRIAENRAGAISGMTINSDSGLRPGATLRVEVRATPGARWANVSLGDDVRIPLHERAPGDYVGTYVIQRGERIDPTRVMTARAGWGEGPVALSFNYPASFQALAMGAGPAVANAEVSSFAMWPRDPDALDPGRAVHFRIEGTPNARAWVTIPGVLRGLELREQRPGVYAGSYIIRAQDDSDAFANAVGVLNSGGQRAIAHLNRGERNYGYGYGR